MVDRSIFLGMSGASDALQQMNLIANNLANANTVGFRADYEVTQASANQLTSKSTRVYPHTERSYSDFKPGPLTYTDRDLDVAIQGRGFIAVQTKDGQEAYTRAGNLEVDPQGFLVTKKGDFVLGQGGLISIPDAARLEIDQFGEISVQMKGDPEKDIVNLGKIKLVDAPIQQLQKGSDGLFHAIGDSHFDKSKQVLLVPKTLEGSNVDTVKTMVDLINLSRQVEMHSQTMKAMENNADRSNKLLDIAK